MGKIFYSNYFTFQNKYVHRYNYSLASKVNGTLFVPNLNEPVQVEASATLP